MHLAFSIMTLTLSGHAAAAAPLTTLAEVRAISKEQAAKNPPVEVEGTVVYFDRKTRNLGEPEGLVIHDGTAGCYVSSRQPFAGREHIRPGTRIRVRGVANPDSYFPNIVSAEVEAVRPGELPEPRRVTGRDLFSREVDSDWVEVEAVVVGVEPGGLAFTLVVEIDGRTFKAEVPVTEDAQRRAAALMQRRVRLQGVVGTIYNEAWQITGRHFFVPSFDQFIPVDGAFESGSAPLRTIGSLLQSDHGIEEMARVRGVVTQSGSGGFYLRDETASTYVQAAEAAGYPVGNELEVEGFAAVAPFRPILRAVRIERLGNSALAMPHRLQPEKGLVVGMHSERVVVDCVFLALRRGLQETVLQCRAGDSFFEAWLPGPDRPDLSLSAGDELCLTGIYTVTTTRPMPRVEWADGFRIILPDAGAVQILRKAPWWTVERVLLAFGAALAVLGVVFIWNWQLRRRVAAQSATIASQVEQATIKDERERIARELHDTLEQHMTGLAMQLGNLAPALDGDAGLARQQLALARGMLQHCRSEARASVGDLRNLHLLGRALPEAMRESLPEAMGGSKAIFQFELHGTPWPLRATTQNHLLRIAREAVFNAVRHADPQNIKVQLIYDSVGVALDIVDDGCGFDAGGKPPVGHFGLVGMRERANKIHATFTIESSLGAGTAIRVRLPWSSPVAHPRTRK
jgi:signal transduction histidine kinase